MKGKYKVEMTGDYTNECYFNHTSELYEPQDKVKEVTQLQYPKLLNVVGSGIFVLEKYKEDFVIIKPYIPHLISTDTQDQQLTGRYYSKVAPIYSKLGFLDILKEVDKTDKIFNVKTVTKCNNQVKEIHKHTIFKDNDYFFISTEEITESEMIKFTEEKLFNSINQGIYEINLNKKIIRMNNTFSKITGYSLEELNELSSKDIIIKYENSNPIVSSYEDGINKLFNREIVISHGKAKIRRKDGSSVWLESTSNIINFKEKIIQTSVINISKTKKSEHKALELEQNLNYISKNSKIAMLYGEDDDLSYTPELENITEMSFLEYSENFYNYILDEDKEKFVNTLKNLSKEKPETNVTFRIKTPKSNIKYLTYFIKDVYGNCEESQTFHYWGYNFKKDKGFITSIALIQDNTDTRKKEEKLQDLADEKAVLLKEIHHRVKNNLQLILSFVNLEKRFNKNDPEKIVSAIQSRIQNMALLHEKTYGSKDLMNINLEDYITDQLKNQISLYGIHDICSKINIPSNLTASVDATTTFGLILDEIFTNTLKYGFDSDKKDKEFYVDIKEDNGNIIIKCGDNGKGLPKDINIYKSPSLGLTIINQLTEQLDGIFEKDDSETGTFYIFKFKKDKF